MSWKFQLPRTLPDPDGLEDNVTSTWVPLNNRSFHNCVRVTAWDEFDTYMRAVQREIDSFDSDIQAAIDIFLVYVRLNLRNEKMTSVGHLKNYVAAAFFSAVGKAVKNLPKLTLADVGFDLCMLQPEFFESMLSPESRGGRRVCEPLVQLPSFVLYDRKDDRQRVFPIGAIHIQSTHSKFVPDEYRNAVAGDIAQWFDRQFDIDPTISSAGTGLERRILVRFAQALSFAALTRSGCGMLWNHVNALFFRLNGKTTSTEGERVVVEVSKVYRCDREPSSLHAMAAWVLQTQKAAKLDKNDGEQQMQLIKIFDCYNFFFNPKGSTHSDLCPSLVALQRTCGSTKYSAEQWRSMLLQYIAHQPLLWDGDMENTLESVRAWTDDKIIEKAYSHSDGVLGVGACGIVKKGMLGDVAIAMKYWNRADEAFVPLLLNEIVAYCRLAASRRHLEVMGTGVPKLLAVGTHYWVGAMVVTEAVGEVVQPYEGGRVQVGDRVLDLNETRQVGKAALSSLRALHAGGVLHGDIAMHNLRAQDIRGGSIGSRERLCHESEEKPNWKAWWIDLGQSRFTSHERFGKGEQRCCANLFEKGFTYNK